MNLLEFNGLLKGDWTLTGIEYSTELIAEAPEFPSHIQIRKGDITQPLPAQDQGTYDVVTALAVLEHLKNPLEAVRNACVALKSGGIFVATCPVPFWDELASRLGLLNNDQHECELDLAAVLGCFEAVGLDVVEFGKFMWAPTSFVPYLGVRLSPAISLNIDAHVRKLKVFDFLFVNQYAIGRRP
jgi:SAM-dependent methyltransferase